MNTVLNIISWGVGLTLIGLLVCWVYIAIRILIIERRSYDESRTKLNRSDTDLH